MIEMRFADFKAIGEQYCSVNKKLSVETAGEQADKGRFLTFQGDETRKRG
jgi:hypothetical protein